jgi:hypothetical protein
MLDCVLKMTEQAEREDKKDGADDEPLVTTATAPTPSPHQRTLVTDTADRL